jgi:uncharacterized DUF497 family protein
MMTLHANGFDWDQGNRAKCRKHGLSSEAIEDLFTRPVAIFPAIRRRSAAIVGLVKPIKAGAFSLFLPCATSGMKC